MFLGSASANMHALCTPVNYKLSCVRFRPPPFGVAYLSQFSQGMHRSLSLKSDHLFVGMLCSSETTLVQSRLRWWMTAVSLHTNTILIACLVLLKLSTRFLNTPDGHIFNKAWWCLVTSPKILIDHSHAGFNDYGSMTPRILEILGLAGKVRKVVLAIQYLIIGFHPEQPHKTTFFWIDPTHNPCHCTCICFQINVNGIGTIPIFCLKEKLGS